MTGIDLNSLQLGTFWSHWTLANENREVFFGDWAESETTVASDDMPRQQEVTSEDTLDLPNMGTGLPHPVPMRLRDRLSRSLHMYVVERSSARMSHDAPEDRHWY